jgi:hypothetical protein
MITVRRTRAEYCVYGHTGDSVLAAEDQLSHEAKTNVKSIIDPL